MATPSPITPSGRMVDVLQAAYDHFNDRLFDRRLPPALLTLSRAPRAARANGFFIAEAWQGEQGPRICELSITPEGTQRPTMDTFSTLVHEMAHFLEHVLGIRPKSPGYHGKEWWRIMAEIGLPPEPAGRSRIRVTHTIEPNGRFARAYRELPAALRLPFRSAEGAADKGGDEDEEKEPRTKQGKRARYEHTCEERDETVTMRGPSGRALLCGDCGEAYEETGF